MTRIVLLWKGFSGDQICLSGDHFTEGGRLKAISEYLELGALANLMNRGFALTMFGFLCSFEQ